MADHIEEVFCKFAGDKRVLRYTEFRAAVAEILEGERKELIQLRSRVAEFERRQQNGGLA